MCRDTLVGGGWSVRWNVCLKTCCEVLTTVPLTWSLCSDMQRVAAQGGAGPNQTTSQVRHAMHNSSHPKIVLEHCPAGRACTELGAAASKEMLLAEGTLESFFRRCASQCLLKSYRPTFWFSCCLLWHAAGSTWRRGPGTRGVRRRSRRPGPHIGHGVQGTSLPAGGNNACELNKLCAVAGTRRSCRAMQRSADTRLRLVSVQIGYFLDPVTQAHPDPLELAMAGDGADGTAILVGKHVNSLHRSRCHRYRSQTRRIPRPYVI